MCKFLKFAMHFTLTIATGGLWLLGMIVYRLANK